MDNIQADGKSRRDVGPQRVADHPSVGRVQPHLIDDPLESRRILMFGYKDTRVEIDGQLKLRYFTILIRLFPARVQHQTIPFITQPLERLHH
ncbi:hypothetical protein D3C84_972290 [compost metagenome]